MSNEKFVITDSGNILYEQKRKLSCKAWAAIICRGLLSREFTWEEIEKKWGEIVNRKNYYNKSFYRPVLSVIQEQIDLSL